MTSIPATPSKADYAAEPDRPLDWIGATDPIALFDDWLASAGETEPNDPNAVSLATVDAHGMPDVRILLLKGLSDAGFDVYTNSRSAKGQQLEANPRAALCFHWKTQRRQVRVRGQVVKVGEAGSDAYFAKRARGSRLSAWASQQSRPAKDRAELMDAMAETEARFAGQDVPRPPHWYGYRIVPDTIEFWQDGAFRVHDRIVFTRDVAKEGGAWKTTRLYP